MPKVSVIIPTYNRSKYLCEAVDSVLAQTYKDYEIIVIDDGSTDNTAEILKSYGGKIKYLYQENSGLSRARNNGIDKSSGEYIAFLDSDDLWLPEKLEKQVAELNKNQDLAFVCSGTVVIDASGKEIDVWRMKSLNSFEQLYEMNYVLILTVLLRRRCFDDVGSFDEKLIIPQDYDLWLRLAVKYKFRYYDLILAKYRLHDNNLSKNHLLRGKDYERILKKIEFVNRIGFIKSRVRIAKSLYVFGNMCYSEEKFYEAGILFFKALAFCPWIGIYYWPLEAEAFKFSFFYRLFNPYRLGLSGWSKGRKI